MYYSLQWHVILDKHKTEPEISMPWEMEDKNIQENVESQKQFHKLVTDFCLVRITINFFRFYT